MAEAGAGFRPVTENIDTITPAGRMMMQMVGSFAEFERAIIRERASAGSMRRRSGFTALVSRPSRESSPKADLQG
jgi:DNA invertase Pin-like site-specific DNA recombinase